MNALKGVKYSHLVLGLFFIGLLTTAVALFGITYLGSRSVAQHEIEQRVQKEQALSSLVFSTLLEQLEGQIRTAALNRELITSVKDRNSLITAHVLAQLGQNSNGLPLDVLLLVDDEGLDLLDMSYTSVDLSSTLTAPVLNELPSNVWEVFADDFATPVPVVTVIGIPIIDPATGELLARLVAGSALNENARLTAALSKLLGVGSLAIVHEDESIAGLGDMTDQAHFEQAAGYLSDEAYRVENDRLYMKSRLVADGHGHAINVYSDQPNTILSDLRSEYIMQFVPFLAYVVIAALLGAFVLNLVTTPALNALLQYANARQRGGNFARFRPGRIAEYNRLGAKFEEAFEAVHNTNAQFRELIEGSLQGVYVHRGEQILYVNRSLLKMLRHPVDNPLVLKGKSIRSLYAAEEMDRMQTYHRLRNSGEIVPTVYEVQCLGGDGSPVWLEQHVRMTTWDGEPAVYVTLLDVTSRKEQEKLLEQQSNNDQLTKLPNRSLFLDRLHQAIGQAEKTGNMAALLVADADRFKAINDTYGHGFGDEIIKILAARMSDLAEWNQTVARLGGDEFALILPDVEDEWELESKAQAVLDAFSTKIDMGDGREFNLAASIGITVCPYDGTDEYALMRQADAAMYQAKADGGNRFNFFSRQMNERAAKTLTIESGLRRAIEAEQLDIHFQPIVDFRTGSITGCEALARWSDPELGTVSPAEFIPIAEESGLIVPLGKLVLRKSCEFHARCQDSGLYIPCIGVNISPRECREDGFVQSIKQVLSETGMDPCNLRLEITENVMFDDRRIDPVTLLSAIKRLGIKISLDDFGTGYSSLSYLKQLPIDNLKIDRSFVSDLEHDTDDQALVEAIISMAAKLGVGVICEGAETLEQCEIIVQLGCKEIQGFYLGKPMPADAFLEFAHDKRFETRLAQQVG